MLCGQADLGGIVNAVSKLPREIPGREIEIQVGSHDRKQIAADLTGPLTSDRSWLYRIVALARESDPQVDFVNDDALVFMPSLTLQAPPETRLTVLHVHQKNDSKVSAQFLPSKGTIDPAPLGRMPSNRFVGEPGWDRYDTRKNETSLFLGHRTSPSWNLAGLLRKTKSSSITRKHWTTVGAIPDDAGNTTRTIHTADRKTDVLATDMRQKAGCRSGRPGITSRSGSITRMHSGRNSTTPRRPTAAGRSICTADLRIREHAGPHVVRPPGQPDRPDGRVRHGSHGVGPVGALARLEKRSRTQ